MFAMSLLLKNCRFDLVYLKQEVCLQFLAEVVGQFFLHHHHHQQSILQQDHHQTQIGELLIIYLA